MTEIMTYRAAWHPSKYVRGGRQAARLAAAGRSALRVMAKTDSFKAIESRRQLVSGKTAFRQVHRSQGTVAVHRRRPRYERVVVVVADNAVRGPVDGVPGRVNAF